MLSDKVANALNQHINAEMYSAYLYMSMSNAANDLGLKGFASWFMVQFHEEMMHGMKMYEYLQRQGVSVKLLAIQQPPHDFSSALEMFEKTLEHEQKVTGLLNNLMEIAKEEKDNATQIFLNWYITEQVEEEENDNDMIQQLKLIKDDIRGVLLLDRELAQRAVTVPTDYSKGIESAMKGEG
ncbi:MAG: ferritin [Chitinivibrionales bacterium]|nr:ferritin [Chitinivibrionales bacterium]